MTVPEVLKRSHSFTLETQLRLIKPWLGLQTVCIPPQWAHTSLATHFSGFRPLILSLALLDAIVLLGGFWGQHCVRPLGCCFLRTWAASPDQLSAPSLGLLQKWSGPGSCCSLLHSPDERNCLLHWVEVLVEADSTADGGVEVINFSQWHSDDSLWSQVQIRTHLTLVTCKKKVYYLYLFQPSTHSTLPVIWTRLQYLLPGNLIWT